MGTGAAGCVAEVLEGRGQAGDAGEFFKRGSVQREPGLVRLGSPSARSAWSASYPLPILLLPFSLVSAHLRGSGDPNGLVRSVAGSQVGVEEANTAGAQLP